MGQINGVHGFSSCRYGFNFITWLYNVKRLLYKSGSIMSTESKDPSQKKIGLVGSPLSAGGLCSDMVGFRASTATKQQIQPNYTK